MLKSLLLSILLRSALAYQEIIDGEQALLADEALPDFTFSRDWQVLGPFQIGTREATWGADPLELHGGFHSLEYNETATFRSPLCFNGTTSWSNHEARLDYESNRFSSAELSVTFPEVDWQWLRDTYGWAALQWQAWARGGIFIRNDDMDVVILNTNGVMEYWIDDEHYFGGDFYGYKKAPLTLRLTKGSHRLEARLIRDIRSMGGIGEPSVDIRLELERSRSALVRTNPEFDEGVLMSDVIGGDFGPLVSPYASVTVRNDYDHDVYIDGIEGMLNLCELELLGITPIRLVPGQTRPIDFLVGCIPSYNRRINAELTYHVDGFDKEYKMHLGTWPDVLYSMHETHRMTYITQGGMVSYAILRPPSLKANCGDRTNQSVPVLLGLHGAGLDADDDIVKGALDELPDLCAWVLFPTGVTPWSGDDWHIWGLADVEAAIAAIPRWIEQVEWNGPGVDIDRWLVSGHSNGGQGAWYILTHRPDKVIAAAAASGYSSIQNYVPYEWWHTSDPGRQAIIQAALLNYRHELLLENAKDIPIIQQHGEKDLNVPVYNSRLLAQRIQQAGADSTFFEVPGKPHYWDGVMTTEPISKFFNEQLEIHNQTNRNTPLNLREFTMVLSDAGEMGSMNGVQVLELTVPAKLAKLHFTFDPLTATCVFKTINVYSFYLGASVYDDCRHLLLDGIKASFSAIPREDAIFVRSEVGWNAISISNNETPLDEYYDRLGGMDAILRSRGTFSIVTHSNGTEDTALQLSRNLCQYYAADTDITDDYAGALNTTGNVISIAIGNELPKGVLKNHPIQVDSHSLSMRFNNRTYSWPEKYHPGLAAIYLRPLKGPGNRLELVVWGVNKAALKTSARLMPLLTGVGQPAFVVTGETMLWKGIEGTLALGFFDSGWKVSQNSYLEI